MSIHGLGIYPFDSNDESSGDPAMTCIPPVLCILTAASVLPSKSLHFPICAAPSLRSKEAGCCIGFFSSSRRTCILSTHLLKKGTCGGFQLEWRGRERGCNRATCGRNCGLLKRDWRYCDQTAGWYGRGRQSHNIPANSCAAADRRHSTSDQRQRLTPPIQYSGFRPSDTGAA